MTHRLTIPVALVLLTAACSGDQADDGADDRSGSVVIVTTTATTTAITTTAPPTITTATPSEPTLAATTGPPSTAAGAPESPSVGEPVVASEPIGEFDSPVDLAVRVGDDALFIVEQPGRVVRYDGESTSVVLDLRGQVSTGSEQGLLGLAFSTDGTLAFVDHTDLDDRTVISEYAVDPDGTLDPASVRVLLVVDQPFRNHNAGDLEIGPDAMLYITLGDGGSGGDPERNASDPSTLLGSILRIDPTPSASAPYSIPADNPFADGAGGAPEVWAWGLRNPWKIAFDTVNGDLWIADVGQNRFEEIDVVGPIDGATAGRGTDFGWSAFEGFERFNDDVTDTGSTTAPVLTYDHRDGGCSVSGGVPYRGDAIPELAPAYVYSDFCSGVIWAFDLAGARNLTLLDGFRGVTAVRAGPDGELYVLEQGGTVHRLVPA